jgi:hypothetical protein
MYRWRDPALYISKGGLAALSSLMRPGTRFGGTAGPGRCRTGIVMETDVMFLDCPEYMDRRGAVRCGLPAEVESWYVVKSTDGPLESAKIRCPRGHVFNGPIESLTWHKNRDTVAARVRN